MLGKTWASAKAQLRCAGGREGGSHRALVPHACPYVTMPTALPLPARPRHPQTSCWHPFWHTLRRRLPGSLPSPSQGHLFGSPWWQVVAGRTRRWAGSPKPGHVLFQRPCSPLRCSAPAQWHSGPVRRELSRGMEWALVPH